MIIFSDYIYILEKVATPHRLGLFFFRGVHDTIRKDLKFELMKKIEEVYAMNGLITSFIYDFSDSSQSQYSTEYTIDGFYVEFQEN